MTDFVNTLNTKGDQNNVGFIEPFVGDPKNLGLAAKEEMVYKYRFLEYTVPALAIEYRLTPLALEKYIDEYEIEPAVFIDDADIDKHNEYVARLYKEVRIRLSGLVALQTMRIWEKLASSESKLTDALELASSNLRDRSIDYVDPRELNTLVSAHTKIVDRQELIKRAITTPAEKDVQEIANQLSKQMKELLEEVNGSHSLPSEQK